MSAAGRWGQAFPYESEGRGSLLVSADDRQGWAALPGAADPLDAG
jgi:hypothetical protein